MSTLILLWVLMQPPQPPIVHAPHSVQPVQAGVHEQVSNSRRFVPRGLGALWILRWPVSQKQPGFIQPQKCTTAGCARQGAPVTWAVFSTLSYGRAKKQLV